MIKTWYILKIAHRLIIWHFFLIISYSFLCGLWNHEKCSLFLKHAACRNKCPKNHLLKKMMKIRAIQEQPSAYLHFLSQANHTKGSLWLCALRHSGFLDDDYSYRGNKVIKLYEFYRMVPKTQGTLTTHDIGCFQLKQCWNGNKYFSKACVTTWIWQFFPRGYCSLTPLPWDCNLPFTAVKKISKGFMPT